MNKAKRKELADLCSRLQDLDMDDLALEIETIRDGVQGVHDEEEQARDSLPDSQQNGTRGEAMTQAIDKLEEVIEQLTTLVDALNESNIEALVATIEEAAE